MHIEGYGELEVDNVKLYQTGSCGWIRNPASFEVSFRVVKTGQYWYKTFAVRERDYNISELGRKMGIKPKDRISLDSRKGKAISEYLHSLAWKYARSLMPHGADVKDGTVYAREPRESQLASVS